jgi:hypothetical protein
MPKMKDADLRALLAAEHSAALGAMQASKLVSERSDAVDYYLGNMAKDMPAPEGRSSAVSFDVSDTIEGLMPSLMDIFTGSDEVVRFDPVSADDVQAAEQETDYTNHVFMNQNPGFVILYSFIKDALLSKVGVVKVWWEEREQEQRETYYDQPDDAYGLIVASPDVEVVEHTEKPDPYYQPQPGMEDQPGPMLHDVTVVTKSTYACAKVMPVPPEEFGIERGARNIKDCNYCYHKVIKTQSQLIEQGYDAEQVRNLPSYRAITNPEELSRDTVDEETVAGDEINKAARLVEIIENYVRMDYEGDGKARLYKVTTSGQNGNILKLDGKPDIVPFDAIPFAAMTPVIMTHRFFGRSIADLVMDIQRIKTALTRGMLDNIYLHNNPRVEVPEANASENTLDDLLVSRAGGVVRTKIGGGLQWQVVPDITGSIYPAFQYLDSRLEQRTGVSKQSQGIDANALQNQSATAVAQMYSASQARMKLIARIFAETGIRDLFWLLHATIKKHASKAQTVRLRNAWVTVDPRNWKTRDDLTVNVGLGNGGKAEQLASLQIIAGMQEKALVGGMTNIVSPQNIYNTGVAITKVIGHKDIDAFFSDPSKQPPLQPKPDPKLIELQAKNEIEKTQAQADIVTQQQKTQAEMALAERKAQLEERLMISSHQMKMEEHRVSMASTLAKHATQPGKDGEGNPTSPDPNVMGALLASLQPPRPRGMRVVRDDQGRVSHTEPMDN